MGDEEKSHRRLCNQTKKEADKETIWSQREINSEGNMQLAWQDGDNMPQFRASNCKANKGSKADEIL